MTGCGVLCGAGRGLTAVAEALRTGTDDVARQAGTLYEARLPANPVRALIDFDVRKELGRKGTSSLDRRSALTMAATRLAIEDSGLAIDAAASQRIGMGIGTGCGSLKSMSDYTMQSLTGSRPYFVDPSLFPNTVLNCATGVTAIRYGLRGVNVTIATGQLAFIGTLSYASNVMRRGYVDAMLIGATEECTPHTAWALRATRGEVDSVGEGAGVFALEQAEAARSAGHCIDAEVLAVVTGFAPLRSGGRSIGSALAGCISRALAVAHVEAAEVPLALTSEPADLTGAEASAVRSVLGEGCQQLEVKRILGECGPATGALQLAALLALHRSDPSRDGRVSLLTATTRDGGVGAALFRGRSRGSAGCS